MRNNKREFLGYRFGKVHFSREIDLHLLRSRKPCHVEPFGQAQDKLREASRSSIAATRFFAPFGRSE
jgi:hypothetical protein